MAFKNKIYSNKIYKTFFSTYEKRCLTTGFISFVISFILIIYHLVLYILYRGTWNFAIIAYYVLITILRFLIIYKEIRYYNKNLYDNEKIIKRSKTAIPFSIILILIDLSLYVPILLLALFEEVIKYPLAIALTIAVLTFIKIISAIYNHFRIKKENNFTLYLLKNISLTSALVSIVALQYTLVASVNDESTVKPYLAHISSLIFVLIFLIGIITLIKSIKYKKAQ